MAEEITFKLRAISDFKDITSNIDVLRKKFQELKMPSDAYKGFDKTFTALETKIISAQDKLKNGFKTGSEINSFKRDLSDIKQLYAQIGTEVKGLNLNEVFKGVDSPELEDARRHLADFENQLNQLLSTDVFKKLDADVKNLEGALGRTARKGVGELVDNLKKGDFDAAAQKIKELQQAIAKMSEGKTKEAYTNFLTQIGLNPSEIGTDLEKIKAQINQVFNGDQVRAAAAGIEEWQTKVHGLEISNIEDLENIIKQIGQELTQSSQGWSTMQRGYEETVDKSKQLNSELDQFKNRIAYFFGMNNAVRLFQRALRSAFNTVKELDKVMTETAVVTDFTVSDMWAQLPEYTARANELGLAIHDVYEASTLYYQQGLKTNEVMAVTNATLRMARIAGLDAADATDRVTNALRGFNMEITEANANNIADVYSKLAAMSASNVDEISTAMTKVASLANNANMEFETTAAFLAQIIETTRESAETAGTALKTVVARFSEVKKLYSEGELLGNDEEGQEIDVNKVSTALRTAGINLNEFLTGQRGLDEIFMELASKWDDLTIVQQRYIATMAAGSRQQSRFIALMSDYARTQELVAAAQSASGASQEQYEKTLESLETKLNRLKNAWDEFVMGLAKDNLIKWAVDALTNLIGAINKLTASMPGALKSISRLGIAFGAFKGAKAIFNGLFTNIGREVQKGMQDMGKKAAPLFAGGFSDKMAQLWPKTIGGLRTSLHQTLLETNVGSVSYTLQDFDAGNYDNVIGKLQQLNKDGKISEATFNSLTSQLKVAGDMSVQFSNGVQRVSTAMSGIGIGLTLIAQLLRSMGLEKLSKVIQAIGLGLTAIGFILPKLITLCNGLGLSFNKLGIYAGAAGAKAAAGGAAATIAWGPFLAIVAAIIVTVGLLTYAIIQSSKTAADKIAESNKKIEEGLDRLQEKYNEINDAIEAIADKEGSLEELAEGTDEWRKSVEELNQQYLELIELMPALGQYLAFDNGHLTIDWNNTEVRDIVEGQAQANRDAQYTRTELNRSLTRANLSDIANNYLSTIFPYLKASNEATAFNMSTQAFDYLARARSGDTEAISYLQSRGLNVPTDRNDLNAWNRIADQLSEGMSGFTEEGWKILDEYMQETSTQRSLLQGYDTAQRQQLLASANVADDMQQAALRFMSQDWFERTDINEDDIARRGYNNNEYKQWARQWAESRGYTYVGVNNRGQITYTDEDDKTQTTDARASRREYAQYQEGLARNQELQDFVSGIMRQDIPEVVQKAFTQTDLLTQVDVEALKTSFEDLTKIQQAAILDVFGDQATYKQYRDQILNEVNAAFSKTAMDISGIELNLDNATANAVNSVYQVIEQQLVENGYQTASDTANSINDIVSQLSTDSGNSFLSYLGSIQNWSNKNVPEVLREMSDLGIEFGDSQEGIEALIQKLINLDRQARTVDLEKVREEIANTAKVLQGLGERNANDRNFSQEEYDELKALGSDLVNDMVWNGTEWTYIGSDLNSLEDAVREATGVLLQEDKKNLENSVRIGQAISDSIEQANGGTITSVNGENFSYEDLYNGNDQVDQGLLAAARRQYLESIGLNSDEFARMTSQALADYFTTQMDAYYGTNGSVLAENQTTLDTITAQLASAITNIAGTPLSIVQGEANANITQGTNDQNVAGILASAAQFGVAEQELEEFNKLLDDNGNLLDGCEEKARDLLNTITKKAGLAQAAKDMEAYGKAISDNIKTLQEFEEGSREYNDALKEITEQTERYFGLQLPEDFMSPENIQLLTEALDGSDQAWTDYVENVNTAQAKTVDWGNGVYEAIDEVNDIASAVDGTEIHIDGTADVSGIIESMFNAGASAQEVADFLNELGYAHVDFKASNFKSLQEIQEWMNNNPGQTLNGSILGSIEATNVRVPNRDSFSGGAGSGGGSGGGGGGGSKKSWKNPYDELYNLTEKINETLRQRNLLEKEYDILLEQRDGDLNALYKNDLKQLDNLAKQLQYQKQLREGRLSQLSNVNNELYETEDGFKTYTEMGVTQYVSYDPITGLVTLDWDGIDKIDDTEVGKAVEAYEKRIQELQGQIEDIDETVLDIEADIYEIQQRGRTEALDMEKRIASALKNQQQKVIDEYQALSDTISNSNDRILNSLQESIDLSRQIRDNTKTEDDIAQKEARLAYLRRDTSGANALEIQQLEKELDEARQTYSDTLIDQSIEKLSNDNQQAADQRVQQIEIMQSQLDWAEETGVFARQAEEMLIDAVTNNNWEAIEKLIKEDEGFQYLSKFAQEQWLDDLEKAQQEATNGVKSFLGEKINGVVGAINSMATSINSAIQQASGGSGSGNGPGGSWTPGGGDDGSGNDKLKRQVEDAYRNAITNTGDVEGEAKRREERAEDFKKARDIYNKFVAANGSGGASFNRLKTLVDELNRKWGLKLDNTKPSSLNAYKTGGLADFTGPAWLDGSKSHPELVLNAKDTENFIALRNILSHLMNGQVGGASTNASGDINLDIDINVDQIGNDYDVDRLVDRVKQNIYQDASYRNINQINFIR